MNLQVRFFGSLVSITKKKNIKIKIEKDAFCLKDLILYLSKSYGLKFKDYIINKAKIKIRPYILILINDISIDLLDELNTSLKNRDIITFLPSIHGGNLKSFKKLE